jgi:hypothetical protein
MEELRSIWERALAQQLVTIEEIEASLTRVEWRPSLAAIQQLLVEFSA